MKITITQVTKSEATVCGQIVAREYAESILLPMLVSQCGSVRGRRIEVVKAFAEAGLSTKAVPEDDREYRQDQAEKAAERARQLEESRQHAERCYQPTERQLAEIKAERAGRAAAIREHGERVRAASRSSNW